MTKYEDTEGRWRQDIERRLRAMEASPRAPWTAITDEDGNVLVELTRDGLFFRDSDGRVVTSIDRDGLHTFDTAGRTITRIDRDGLHTFDTSGLEQVTAGRLGTGVYGLGVIQGGTLVSLADFVFGSRASSVITQESTSSTAWTDLTTNGPQVTVTVGQSGRVLLIGGATVLATRYGTAGVARGAVGFNASGANTLTEARLGAVAGFDGTDLIVEEEGSACAGRILSGLNPGSTTFKLRYRHVNGDESHFSDRWIYAQPL